MLAAGLTYSRTKRPVCLVHVTEGADIGKKVVARSGRAF